MLQAKGTYPFKMPFEFDVLKSIYMEHYYINLILALAK